MESQPNVVRLNYSTAMEVPTPSTHLEETMEGLLSLEMRVIDDISLTTSCSGDGVWDLGTSEGGGGASERGSELEGVLGRGLVKPRIRDHSRNNIVSIIGP